MKKIRILSLMLAVTFILSLMPAVFAQTVTDLKEGEELSQLAKNDEMNKNEGTIVTNNGVVTNNDGSVKVNYGSVINNNENGTVEQNYGTVSNNENNIRFNNVIKTGGSTVEGIVESNNGTIESNYSTVKINNEQIDRNYKTVETNNGKISNNVGDNINKGLVKINNGEISNNSNEVEKNEKTGIITTNKKLVSENNGLVKTNDGTVNNNGETGVINNNKGTVTENGGTIKKNLEEVTNNSNTIVNNTGTVKTNNSYIETNTVKKNKAGEVEQTGTVEVNNGTVEINEGTVVNNTIIDNKKSTILGNTGLVKNNDGDILANMGEVENNTGTVAFNLTAEDKIGEVTMGDGGIVGYNSGVLYNAEMVDNAMSYYGTSFQKGTDTLVGIVYTREEAKEDSTYFGANMFAPADQWNETTEAEYTVLDYSAYEKYLGKAPKGKKFGGWSGSDGNTYKAGSKYSTKDTPLELTALWIKAKKKAAVSLIRNADGSFGIRGSNKNSFIEVRTDKETVDREYYELYTDENGVLCVAFTEAYLNTLSAGEHNVEIRFTNGTVYSTLSI